MLKIKYLSFALLFFLGTSTVAQKFKLIDNDNHRLAYMGRVAHTDSTANFYWCGSSVQIKVKNSQTVKVVLGEVIDLNYYDVIVDGKYTDKIKVLKGKDTYTIATNLDNQPHVIQIFKATNTDERVTSFYGFLVEEDAQVLKQKNKQKLKMEFFGNSITAGHGVEVPDGSPDTGVPEFFNNYFTYAAITARYFTAQYYNTSKSGIGITVSWGKDIMPEIYDRLNPNDPSSKWDFSNYQPDIVVINLFQNDHSLVVKREHEQFINRFGTTKPSEDFIIKAYADFVLSLRKVYPKASIICALGNMDVVNAGSKWPGYIKAVVETLHDPKIYVTIFKPKNTPGHPRMKEQQVMADELIQFIKDKKLDK